MLNGEVLVTGATGHIGRHVLDALVTAGYRLHVATPDAPPGSSQIRWSRVDFTASVDYEALVGDAEAVVHLAAELCEPERMNAVNVDATRRLAQAAEARSVGLFVYTSTVAVYGFRHRKFVDEDTPTLAEGSETTPYLAEEFLKLYGETKLLGETAMKASLTNSQGIILRLTNVVDEASIASVLSWGSLTQLWRGYRRTHQIYVRDVAAVILFFLSRYAGQEEATKAGCETYIVSEDDDPENTYGILFRRYRARLGLGTLGSRLTAPSWMDRMKDRVKFRRIRVGFPAGAMYYSSAKLASTGFQYPFGIKQIQGAVISERAKELTAPQP
jgi:nucleoside-diphosphate-sugar epimerase